MRFTDFLRTAVLLFGGAGTALAVVAIAGASADDDTVAIAVAVGWWTLAAVGGLWLGRRMAPTPGIERLLAGARATNTLPEVEPGTVLFNRLWPLAVFTVVCGARGVPDPADPRDRRRLRDRRGAHLAQAGRRPCRRSRTATACASSSTAARRSASRSWCAPRGRGRSRRPSSAA